MEIAVFVETLLLVYWNVLTFSKGEDYCVARNGVDEAPCGSTSKIELYYTPGSPPCRSVILAAKVVGVDLDLKLTNLRAGEHLTPEFLKMNPQHTVPTINDNGFILAESRAIMGYLVDQYAKDDTLYPKNAKERALVNQRLFFDIGTLYQRFSDYYYPIAFGGASPDKEKMKKLEEAFEFLDQFLEGQAWVAGSSMTIADISITSTVASPVVLGFEIQKFKNVVRWFDNCKKAIPDYEEITNKGFLEFKKFFENAKLC